MATDTKKNTTKTSTTNTVKKTQGNIKAEVKSEKEIELENQLSMMMKMVESLQNQVSSLANNGAGNGGAQNSAPTFIVSTPSTDVTLVYMSNSLGVIQTNNTILNCTRFGEEFVLPRSEFDAIVGKYRHWFDEGILAVSDKNIDVAAAKGLKTDKEYGMSSAILERLGSMSANELEALWEKTNIDSHRLCITTFYKRKFIENKEPGYRDRVKIDLLNRLTDGGFNRESLEISGGANLKIRPTEL